MEKTSAQFETLIMKVSEMLVDTVEKLELNLNFPKVKHAKGHGKPNINTPRGAFYNHYELKQEIDFNSLRK